jgi:heptosyltransferase III
LHILADRSRWMLVTAGLSKVFPMKGHRYVRPTGVHGLRRRAMRWLINRFMPARAACSEVALPSHSIHRILVCRTSHSLGNSILLTALLNELERVYPGAEVDIVTQSGSARELYGKFFNVRQVLVLPTRLPPHLLQAARVIGQMRKIHYDLAIDPDLQSKTARILLALARARYKLGFISEEKAGDVTHGVAVPDDVAHIAQLPVYQLRKALGRLDASYPVPCLRLDERERMEGRRALDRLVGFAPGASAQPVVGVFANGTGDKRLGREWWDRFLDTMEHRVPTHAFVEFAPVMGESLLGGRYPVSYCSDLRKLSAVLSALSLYISVDCGVMHLAWASGAPTVGIFVGSDVVRWAPYGAGTMVVETGESTPEEVAERIATRFLERVALAAG